MQKLNGMNILCRYKLFFTTALAVVFIGGAANADIVLDNQTIPAADIQQITISPTSGTIFITTTGYTVTKNGSTPPPTGNSVVINSFTVSSNSITTGNSINLNWSSTNATSCSASGGSGGWAGGFIGTTGSKSVIPTNAGTHEYILSCFGANTVTASVFVTVTDNTPPPPQPSPSNCSAPALDGSIVAWESFWGSNFPDASGGNDDKILDIGRTGYRALVFNMGDIHAVGSLLLIETTTSPGTRIGTLSKCPGDFNAESICKNIWGLGGSIKWAHVDDPSVCTLEPGTTYYFNLTFTDGVNASSSTCAASSCIVRIQSGFRALP